MVSPAFNAIFSKISAQPGSIRNIDINGIQKVPKSHAISSLIPNEILEIIGTNLHFVAGNTKIVDFLSKMKNPEFFKKLCDNHHANLLSKPFYTECVADYNAFTYSMKKYFPEYQKLSPVEFVINGIKNNPESVGKLHCRLFTTSILEQIEEICDLSVFRTWVATCFGIKEIICDMIIEGNAVIFNKFGDLIDEEFIIAAKKNVLCNKGYTFTCATIEILSHSDHILSEHINIPSTIEHAYYQAATTNESVVNCMFDFISKTQQYLTKDVRLEVLEKLDLECQRDFISRAYNSNDKRKMTVTVKTNLLSARGRNDLQRYFGGKIKIGEKYVSAITQGGKDKCRSIEYFKYFIETLKECEIQIEDVCEINA
jgi:hypothetical protein